MAFCECARTDATLRSQSIGTSSTSATVRRVPVASSLRSWLIYSRFQDTFGLDWTPQSITMWVNSRVRIAFRYGFGKKNFWELGA